MRVVEIHEGHFVGQLKPTKMVRHDEHLLAVSESFREGARAGAAAALRIARQNAAYLTDDVDRCSERVCANLVLEPPC